MQDAYLLEIANLSKAFPGVQALDKVNLRVRRKTVHALLGENGAGKSTLMKVLIGIYPFDDGHITFDGESFHVHNVKDAMNKGISMIFQELDPIPLMTVAENICIGKEPLRMGHFFIDKRKMATETAALLNKLEMSNINPRALMRDLSIAKTQMVEICRALSFDAKLIIMDEPTSALTEDECSHLFKIIGNLREEGVTFVFITHKLEEVFRIADEVTIMRDGKHVSTEQTTNLTRDRIISMMVGRTIEQLFPKEPAEIGEEIFSVRDLTIESLFRNVSFGVRRGEILGLSGLVGSGRTEVMEAIFGYRKLDSGEIYIRGSRIKIGSPTEAIKRKIAFITEDRKLTGIFPELNIIDNMTMPILGRLLRKVLLNRKRMNTICTKERNNYNIKTPSLKQLIKYLSGGNQQKVIVSRWLLSEPDIILIDEPTRGIDVGAKAEIHKFLSKLAQQGKCIIMVSSELPEILAMSDRIVVMHEGQVAGILNRSQADQESIMQLATGLAKE